MLRKWIGRQNRHHSRSAQSMRSASLQAAPLSIFYKESAKNGRHVVSAGVAGALASTAPA